jgi:N-acetylneuraminate synthase
MEINNLPYLKYIGSKGIPIVLSTGMSTIDEIINAVRAIETTGNKQLCILHCVSVYPAPAEIINLNNMVMLQEKFPNYVVGYSDHTIGYEVATASIALGAALVEKHFTLDNKKMGMDNNMATEPAEMKSLVNACHSVYSAMGSKERILLDGEEEQRLKMRRSLVATRDIHVGETLSTDDIEAKRPGDGITPDHLDDILGRIVNTDIPKGHLIKYDHLN